MPDTTTRLSRITSRRERACRVDQMLRTDESRVWLLRWDAAYHDEARYEALYSEIWWHLVGLDGVAP